MGLRQSFLVLPLSHTSRLPGAFFAAGSHHSLGGSPRRGHMVHMAPKNALPTDVLPTVAPQGKSQHSSPTCQKRTRWSILIDEREGWSLGALRPSTQIGQLQQTGQGRTRLLHLEYQNRALFIVGSFRKKMTTPTDVTDSSLTKQR
jgi:hypothetical protein